MGNPVPGSAMPQLFPSPVVNDIQGITAGNPHRKPHGLVQQSLPACISASPSPLSRAPWFSFTILPHPQHTQPLRRLQSILTLALDVPFCLGPGAGPWWHIRVPWRLAAQDWLPHYLQNSVFWIKNTNGLFGGHLLITAVSHKRVNSLQGYTFSYTCNWTCPSQVRGSWSFSKP